MYAVCKTTDDLAVIMFIKYVSSYFNQISTESALQDKNVGVFV